MADEIVAAEVIEQAAKERPLRVTQTRERAEKRREACCAEELAKAPSIIPDLLAELDKIAESTGEPRAKLKVGTGALREAIIKELSAEGYAITRWELDGLDIYWG